MTPKAFILAKVEYYKIPALALAEAIPDDATRTEAVTILGQCTSPEDFAFMQRLGRIGPWDYTYWVLTRAVASAAEAGTFGPDFTVEEHTFTCITLHAPNLQPVTITVYYSGTVVVGSGLGESPLRLRQPASSDDFVAMIATLFSANILG